MKRTAMRLTVFRVLVADGYNKLKVGDVIAYEPDADRLGGLIRVVNRARRIGERICRPSPKHVSRVFMQHEIKHRRLEALFVD
jgi:hypothetical protein